MSALLTEQEAAAMLHVSPRTLRDLRSKGMIRYIRLSPRKIAFTPDDIAEYIDKHRCQFKAEMEAIEAVYGDPKRIKVL